MSKNNKPRSAKIKNTLISTCRAGIIFSLTAMITVTSLSSKTSAFTLPFSNKKPEDKKIQLDPLTTTKEVNGLATDVREDGKPREVGKKNKEQDTAQALPEPDMFVKTDWSTLKKDDSGKRTKLRELEGKRTANSKTFKNTDGSETVEYSFANKNIKEGSNWKEVDTALEQKGKSVESKSNSWKTTFLPLSDKSGITVNDQKGKLDILLKEANNVEPFIVGDDPNQVVQYKDVWKDVDVVYELQGTEVKENIIVKSSEAVLGYSFELPGSKISPVKDKKGWFEVQSGLGQNLTIPAPTVATANEGVVGGDPIVVQTAKDSTISISLDNAWLQKQSKDAFPIVIDPSFTNGIGNNYVNFKSDGFICYANQGCGTAREVWPVKWELCLLEICCICSLRSVTRKNTL